MLTTKSVNWVNTVLSQAGWEPTTEQGGSLGVGVEVGLEGAVAVGVAVGVGVELAVGVGVGVVPDCTSNDPTSMRPLNMRTNPGPR